MSIENPRDLEEYLKTLLDFKNKLHQQFFSELIQKRQPGSTKKSDRDSIVTHPKASDKKNTSKSKGALDEVAQQEAVKVIMYFLLNLFLSRICRTFVDSEGFYKISE